MSSQYGLTTPDEILRKALEKEEQAREFYGELAAVCSVEFVRELLQRLENEEAKHVRMVEAMLSRLESGKDVG